ncbi:MAG: hypothetical protein KAH01_04985 [Caldisericia bacterium]|nr:hypothetical protein [Caldisericia bacterium]
MTSTILSRTDAELILKTIGTYGKVVKTEELLPIFKTKYCEAAARNRIHLLNKNGWFIHIKQGLYLVNDSITGQFQGNLPLLAISHCLFEDSYVSLAHALHYHNLLKHVPDTISSINGQISKKFSYQSYTFKFIKVKTDFYFGYRPIPQQKRTIQIAEVEKAILDYLYVDINFTTPEIFFEPVQEHRESIDFDKFQQYALRFSETVRRKAGFLLDHIKLNTKQLHASVKDSKGYAKFTKEATIFNSKWRVYYENKVLQ